ncbi:hypothetical protein NC652_013529 [Populus alba x Populus x berolinensis]|uniref:Uncharacterized protein n=1 Tax=Populus alba x Populus x berolinensis TaxID=444605 RepID=A0AAD6QUW0_9ROSI|nr:hypothetical protein NC652_012426 [Populus alba x Populus x berolinensis]KAJ6929672.1 hypothetical protein NC652_013529 [Populus alba x Populus x berolinensis]KAJ6996911.1 hypothetical protein NC653_013485 [Populus alba x Populus x berolinensis]
MEVHSLNLNLEPAYFDWCFPIEVENDILPNAH